MFLQVTPAGGKLWRLKDRIDGKEKLLSIGKYPAVSLSEARESAENARRLIAAGKTQRSQAIGQTGAANCLAEYLCSSNKAMAHQELSTLERETCGADYAVF